ncbi:hypothetical protein F5Y03DRAFT_340356 [Xylaria venustula]|nr:hypothetical protein F5Y03DRAFT_340356 [Xylaria venustula]
MREEVNIPLPNKIGPLKNKPTYTKNQGTHGALDRSAIEAEREKGTNVVKPPVEIASDYAINPDQSILTVKKMSNQPFLLSSDHCSHSTDIENGEIHQQDVPSYDAEAQTSKRLSDFEASKRPVKKAKASKPQASPNHIDASPKTNLEQSCFSLSYDRTMTDAPKENQVDIFEDGPYLPDILGEVSPKEGELLDNTLKSRLISPEVFDASKSLRAEHITARSSHRWRGAENLEQFPAAKAYGDHSDTEESIHPNSRAWAHKITERSRKKNSALGPQVMKAEIEHSDGTPTRSHGYGKNHISKRDITLANRREAVSDSVHEVTTAVLRYMQSKESALDEIVENYQRKGRQLIDTILDRQAIELHEVVSAFDNKCTRLGNMFADGARLARTVRGKLSDKDDPYLRAWGQRNKELDEEIKKVWEAMESI